MVPRLGRLSVRRLDERHPTCVDGHGQGEGTRWVGGLRAEKCGHGVFSPGAWDGSDSPSGSIVTVGSSSRTGPLSQSRSWLNCRGPRRRQAKGRDDVPVPAAGALAMKVHAAHRATHVPHRRHRRSPVGAARVGGGLWIAIAALSLAVGWSTGRSQEMPIEGGLPMETAGPACGCRGGQTPPWHGSVAAAPGGWHAPACAPACGHGYGPVCGQMGAGCGWWGSRGMGYSLPPLFPRLSTFCRDGYLPTPPPVAVPRCHNCGVMIDGGF